MKRPLRIGITGKMGSGKSTFCKIMREFGIKVLEADVIAKEVMATSKDVANFFGKDVFRDGDFNSDFITKQIFNNEILRKELENIVHPVVSEIFEEEFNNCTDDFIALETAIMFQTGFYKKFDFIILIDASDEVCLSHLKNSRFSRQDILDRLKIQGFDTNNDFITEYSNFVIQNFGDSKEKFETECREFLKRFIKIQKEENSIFHKITNSDELEECKECLLKSKPFDFVRHKIHCSKAGTELQNLKLKNDTIRRINKII